MRVVIDTNVVVSAAFKNKGPEEVLQFIVSRHDFEWVVSSLSGTGVRGERLTAELGNA